MSSRPLSPHLQVYRPQLTSILSISHRASGVFLSLGSVLLLYWLGAIAAGPEAYAQAREILSSTVGKIIMFGWTGAFFYHMCNGIRHLFWDIGMGYELKSAYRSGYAVVILAALLTVLTWASVLDMLPGGAA